MKSSSTSPLTNDSIQEVSKIFKMISDPTRLSILFLLQKEELSVGVIAVFKYGTISHFSPVKTLKTSRLVKSKRVGKNMIYSLDDLHIFSILEQVSTHIGEQEK